jgi:hypothetical protein
MDHIANRDVLHAEWQQHLHALGSNHIESNTQRLRHRRGDQHRFDHCGIARVDALADSDIGNLPVISWVET